MSLPVSYTRLRWLLPAALMLSALCSFSQTNISGIVNTYHQVVEVIPAKACVRVSDITGVNVNSRVLLLQMKGGTITTATGSAFGDTTSTGEAGFYEAATICYIRGDSVFFFHNLINSYTPGTGKVQLVQFAEYTSANVVDTLKAAPWNETTGTGGVIALFADADITLNAPIYADSSGYRGGAFYNHSGTCSIIQPAGTAYAYDATTSSNNNGAYKGEGIATVPGTLDGGKGAPANGGGGGNNHNNSGGGGANLTAGGNGGGNSSSGPTGCNTANNWGRGGKPLKSWGGTKIYMGGGGGAGHANNGSAAFNFGGNGGGIIFIWTPQLNGNNKTISANGGNGGASQSDGAGGGGAGGTIILQVTNFSGSLTVEAKGGNGGQSDDGGVGGRCFGGGGGGSGGVICFSGTVPGITTSVAGGTAGPEISRDAGCNAAVPGSDGAAGNVLSSYTFTRSTSNAGYCALLLPSKLLSFTASPDQQGVRLQWQMEHPELVLVFTIEKKTGADSWKPILTMPAQATLDLYTTYDEEEQAGDIYYRLKITERAGQIYYSSVRRLFVEPVADDFITYPNPATARLTIRRARSGAADIQLTDISGRIILAHRTLLRQTEFILPALAPGLYFLRVNDKVKKLLIRQEGL